MFFFDPTTRRWYTEAIAKGETVWSDVFDGAYGRGLVITCSRPVYGPDGKVKAVVAIRCMLSEISKAVTDVRIRDTGRAIVVDGEVIMGLNMQFSGTEVVGTQSIYTFLTLNKGDVLYLYTDGVTEATNSDEKLYDEPRLEEVINTLSTASLEQFLKDIKSDIDLFVGEAPQFDDITMLVLRYGDEKK